MFVLDCATPIADLRPAHDQGYVAVMRYGPPSRYAMSMAECTSIRSQHMAVGHIFEVEGDRALGGASQGAADGAAHDRWATACGAPPRCRLVYNAVDSSNITDAQIRGPVTDYARAFDLACTRPTMPYGPYSTIEILCGEQHVAPYGWQCAGMSGSGTGSGGSYHCSDGSVRRLSRYAAMFQDVGQVFGGQADRNAVLRSTIDWAWGGDLPAPDTPPDPGDPDMVNWRPYRVADGPQPDAQYMVTWDGGGRPRRLYLAPGDPQFFWGASWLMDANPIVLTGDAGRKFLAIPEAGSMPDVSSIASAVVTAITPLLPTGGVDLDGLAQRIVSTLGDALRR